MQPEPTLGTTSGRVAANVRAELAARQIRRSDFAAALNWSSTTANRRLKGETWPAEDVEAAANFLGLPLTTLTSGRAA